MPTLELLRMLNEQDALVAPAVASVLAELAVVVDATVTRLEAGGSVHYFGAGSSGRVGVLDAAEVVPTFGVGPGVFVAHHAGGAGRGRGGRRECRGRRGAAERAPRPDWAAQRYRGGPDGERADAVRRRARCARRGRPGR